MKLHSWQLVICVCIHHLLAHGVKACENISCFTWNMIDMTLSCNIMNIQNSDSHLQIVDPYNTTHVICSEVNNSTVCNSKPEIRNIHFDTLKKELVLHWESPIIIPGKWLCIHGSERIELYLDATKGSQYSTKIGLKTEIKMVNNTYVCTFNCYSCSRPYGDSVEFMMNEKTLDELREDENKCYHKSRECNPNKCVCCKESHRYILKHEMSISTQIQSIGCRMRFYDEKFHRLQKKEVFISFEDLVDFGNGTYRGHKESDILIKHKPTTEKTRNVLTASSSTKYLPSTDFERTKKTPYIEEELPNTTEVLIAGLDRLEYIVLILIFLTVLICWKECIRTFRATIKIIKRKFN